MRAGTDASGGEATGGIRHRSWLPDAAVGVVLAILLVLVVSTVPTSPNAGLLLSYLAVWVPFAGTVVGSRAVSLGIAIAVSGLMFALVHVLQATTVTEAWVAGLGTLVFGLATASVAALTGRLGGAIIAHVMFNALVVVPALF
jgi:hypothetical protein